ncbi:MAG: hypothetical protein AAF108_07595 [Planctomycetota bacterium]
MTPPSDFQPVCLVGAAGGFGRAFDEQLSAEGVTVHRVDTAPQTAPRTAPDADVIHPERDPGRLSSAVAESRLILFCIDERSLIAALDGYVAAASPGTVLVDICSTKRRVTEAIATSTKGTGLHHLSIHPMFAPSPFAPSQSFAGKNVVWHTTTESPAASAFLDALGRWGAVLHELDPEAHDRAVVGTQVFAHAALMLFGLANNRLDVSPEARRAVETPNARLLAALTARQADCDPELYLSIQRSADERDRRVLERALTDLLAAVRAGDAAGFAELFGASQRWLGPEAGPARELAQDVIDRLPPLGEPEETPR